MSIDVDKKLYDACEIINTENLHRIVVIDKESHLAIGTICLKDILLHIIRHFKKETDEYFEKPISELGILG